MLNLLPSINRTLLNLLGTLLIHGRQDRRRPSLQKIGAFSFIHRVHLRYQIIVSNLCVITHLYAWIYRLIYFLLTRSIRREFIDYPFMIDDFHPSPYVIQIESQTPSHGLPATAVVSFDTCSLWNNPALLDSVKIPVGYLKKCLIGYIL